MSDEERERWSEQVANDTPAEKAKYSEHSTKRPTFDEFFPGGVAKECQISGFEDDE